MKLDSLMYSMVPRGSILLTGPNSVSSNAIMSLISWVFLGHPPCYRHHGKAEQGSVEKRRHGQQNSLLTCGQPASHLCFSYVLAWKWRTKFFAVFVIFTSGVGRPLEIIVFFSSKVLHKNVTERKDWTEWIFSLILTQATRWNEPLTVSHWTIQKSQFCTYALADSLTAFLPFKMLIYSKHSL